MGRYAQFVIGPAGSGKTTYTNLIRQFCENGSRSVHCINLDPAAEDLDYPVSVDIRDLISVDEVQEELVLGPNGGLIFCFEYLLENMDWLRDKIQGFEDDYLIIDCPGQIELYLHFDLFKRVVDAFKSWDYNICTLYLIDSLFLTEPTKFVSGMLACLSAMVKLETPHLNLITKLDLLEKEQRKKVLRYLNPYAGDLLIEMQRGMHKRFLKLNQVLAQIVDEFSLVAFVPWDISDEESIADTLLQVDFTMQYGENEETKESFYRRSEKYLKLKSDKNNEKDF
ncbi:gpn-loop gtpase 3 [Anaeramoeba flamelloides]|uniref:GPN-loop GTPase 3 n=1 Tax=Anaeramoeba flamelloides TaxID=1746091 RepID=A0AAV7ZLJ4_9EUKA|nr:gpn-loop gtpase [Anaeramoeba flamelloides]KAJ6249718.1 gpn-loop gtpase 3 [Anaeramoeba flamelloides]